MPNDILIVGAGPSGLTAAIELYRRGYRPRIIDQLPEPSPYSRALAINPRTLKILGPCGAREALVRRGNKIRTARLFGPEGELVKIDLGQLPAPYDFMLILPQTETEEVLAETLQDYGGTIERGTTLKSLHQIGGRSQVVLTLPDGSDQHVSPDVVIGADGAHSPTRHMIGQSFKGSAYENEWGLADVEVETDLPLDGISVFDRAPVLFALFPLGGKRVRLMSDQADILEHVPEMLRIAEVHWHSTFKISHRLVDSYQSGSVFLVGDAAHIHSPFGGRGMNMGIEDAAWLAWQISTGRTDEYTEDRRPVAHQVIESVDPSTRLMASERFWAKFVRRTLIPLYARSHRFQDRFLPVISASDTPFPPWLSVEGIGSGDHTEMETLPRTARHG
ncbi:FAD-dependent monooxygenase [Pseudovibrio exalbescens]|uniref:FAD-dependent oxidoreductase n=1 Tax=Pseudovibrio exalbescens TaxID=197461 RepID=UPI002366CD0C|nr:FAD-dependent monooxygenase [Pseudovibrio exalbescens]MDD7909368.1 FAD-dependent monooxygenase [Pseudovibrio exalbescens]